MQHRGLIEWVSGGVLLSHEVSLAVPSALRVLASGFGMGPGVSLSLWPPKHLRCSGRRHTGPGRGGLRVCGVGFPTVYREPQSGREQQAHSHAPPDLSGRRCCQVIGLLVPVSSTGLSSLLPHPAYQPSRLLGASHPQGAWKSHLEDGFPLRCFQRLSGPNVANQRCSWRNN